MLVDHIRTVRFAKPDDIIFNSASDAQKVLLMIMVSIQERFQFPRVYRLPYQITKAKNRPMTNPAIKSACQASCSWYQVKRLTVIIINQNIAKDTATAKRAPMGKF